MEFQLDCLLKILYRDSSFIIVKILCGVTYIGFVVCGLFMPVKSSSLNSPPQMTKDGNQYKTAKLSSDQVHDISSRFFSKVLFRKFVYFIHWNWYYSDGFAANCWSSLSRFGYAISTGWWMGPNVSQTSICIFSGKTSHSLWKYFLFGAFLCRVRNSLNNLGCDYVSPCFTQLHSCFQYLSSLEDTRKESYLDRVLNRESIENND